MSEVLELLERGAVLCQSDMPALYGDIALLRLPYSNSTAKTNAVLSFRCKR